MTIGKDYYCTSPWFDGRVMPPVPGMNGVPLRDYAEDLARRFEVVKQQRDEAERQRDSARFEVKMLLDERNRATTERDGARKEAERYKGLWQIETKDANKWADRHRAARAELGSVTVERDQLLVQVASMTKIGELYEADLKRAEQKIADIGWRKNKLIKAIEARGFVVRWQKDGTPEVLTKEEAAERDKPKPKPESSFANWLAFYSRTAMEDYFRNMERRFLFSDLTGGMGEYKLGGLRAALAVTKPPVGAPEDKVEKVEHKVEYKTYSWDTRPGAVNYLHKEETTPPPVAQDYYNAAMKAVYGYTISPLSWAGVLAGTIARLDAALDAELRKAFGQWSFCEHPRCPNRGCPIWSNRPWKRA